VNNGLLVFSFVFFLILIYFTMLVLSPDQKPARKPSEFWKKYP